MSDTPLSRSLVIFTLLMQDKEKLQAMLAELEEREKIIRQWIEEDKRSPAAGEQSK